MKQIKFIILCTTIMFGFTACSKWLDVKPYDQVAEDDLYSTEEGFKKVLNGVYIDLNTDELYGQTLTVEMVEIMAHSYLVDDDILTWGNYIDLDNRNFTSEYWRNRLDNTWNKAYALIRNCNTLLEKMDQKKSLFTGNNYNIIKGEALGLRALLHFDMFRLFGPVYKLNPTKESIPYCTTTSLQVQELLPGNEVMRHVIEDLEAASECLKDDPIITSSDHLVNHSTTGDNFLEYRTLRLNYYAIQALLARAYFYISSYSDGNQAEYKRLAQHYAESVINVASEHFPFVDKANILGSPENVDRIFASELIFALSNTNRNLMFKNNNDPDHRPQPVLTMDPVLLEAPYFGGGETTGGSTDDYRYIANWKKSGNSYYFYKYADLNDVSLIQNTMVPMIRLGEMYIIIADLYDDYSERPIMGQWANKLREHRGVEKMDESTYAPRYLVYEAVRELYGEGQLFFFYKRNYSSILTVHESPSQFTTPSEKFYVVPLPDTETENRQ